MKADQSGRLPAFDNLRTLMVLLVLVFHSAASYCSAVNFWPFHESTTSVFFDLFMFLCDIFMMAVLFFIAGYFALPSLARKSSFGFIAAKIKRLGIPWLVITCLVLPVLDYFHYARLTGSVGSMRSYATYWAQSMMKILDFRVGWMDMSAYWFMTEHFYQRYMWFISLLLLFFVILALGRFFFPGLIENSGRTKSPSIYKIIAGVAIVNVVLFGLVRFLAYPEFMGSGWFSLGNIIQFQAGKLTIYACYFVMGMIAYRRRWFKAGTGVGRFWIWGIVCFCLFGLNMMILKNLKGPVEPSMILKLGFVIFYPVWTLSFLGLFLSLAVNHWNRAGAFHRTLARYSYDMYLVHYIIPFCLPVLLSGWAVPIGIKFVVVAVVTILFSYGISRFLVKPFPKSVIFLLLAFSLVLGIMN